MRILLCLTVSFLFSIQVSAQLPQLTSADPNSPITLRSLDVAVQVMGNKAITTFTMTFQNPSANVLEGNFAFPLPQGAYVTRYALDVNGKMREGVPVEKQRATQVFEAIERRQVDPGLLEKTEGNNFRTRIYPVPARGERRVIVGFEQELYPNKEGERVYHLPLVANDVLQRLGITVHILHPGVTPLLSATPLPDLAFRKTGEGYRAAAQGGPVQVQGALQFRIPEHRSEPEVFVQNSGGKTYFSVYTPLPERQQEKRLPKKLAIIWDHSLSGLYRDTAGEIRLLNHYLQRCGNTTVLLYSLRHTFQPLGTYAIRGGNTAALLQTLRGLPYDGGTDYSKIRVPKVEEVLFFSDGVSTLSDALFPAAPCPVSTITGSSRANAGVLKAVAEENGGVFIDLQTTSPGQAVERLTRQALVFLGVKGRPQTLSVYPSRPAPVAGGFTLGGVYDGRPLTLRLEFGYGKTVTMEKEVHLSGRKNNLSNQWDLPRMVAQKQLAELERNEEKNRPEILRLGKKHSLVTSFTSLMVLETLDDYVQYAIQPPAELLEGYNQRMQEKRSEITERRKETIENAIAYSDELWAWWNTRFPGITKPVETLTSQAVSDRGSARVDARALAMRAPVIKRDEEVSTNANPIPLQEESTVRKALTGSVAGIQLSDVVVVGYSRSTVTVRGLATTAPAGGQLIVVDGEIASAMPQKEAVEAMEVLSAREGVALYGSRAVNGVLLVTTKGAGESAMPAGEENASPQIQLHQKTSATDYMQVMTKTPRHQQYRTYLQLREKHLLDPGFYYDMTAFFATVDKAVALQIVTNLGELDFQNHELYKLFGFTLRELGEHDYAAFIFKKVLHWRPQEPQSYRDYALALLETGNYQQALDTLYRALTHHYTSDVMQDYDGIEEIIVTELSHLVHRYPDKVNAAPIPKKFLRNIPVDVRVVLNWNMDDTDMDLWVTDPGGETCDYRNNETKPGGRLSEDFTQGYGPEQFLLKKARKGKYKVQVHYYGNNSAKLAGKTTLLVEIYTHYGRKNEERRLITLQLDEEEKEGVYVGEFTF